jgi:uncharacterized protein YndB with AHSA1/START domain
MVDCEMDVRVGGGYRFSFVFAKEPGATPMVFFGKYLEVTPHSRLVWTNEEGPEGGQVTTVTLEEREGKTLLTMRDVCPSKAALDEAMESGSTSGFEETYGQLDEVLA